MDFLKGLNEKQQEAVKHVEGPMLVVAGAGSGKTKALTHRIANLIINHRVDPSSILAVTFTNKAANEMTERVERLISEFNIHSKPIIGTFHSICVRILRKHLHEMDMENAFSIYDSTDQQILMKRVLKELNLDPKKFNPKAILAGISGAKNQLIGPEEYEKISFDYFSEKVSQCYKIYQRELKKANALDFDDIIMTTVELFKAHPNILSYYQNKFQYISVDEYQDTNHAQYVLTHQLAHAHKNLTVIGDSDQSIYSWRGANMRNLLDFEKDFDNAKVVLLEQNYRSTKKILQAAQKVIEKNVVRKDKKIWTDNDEGDNIDIYESFNEKDEASYVVNQITRILSRYESPKYDDFSILYRTNAQSRVIEEIFLRQGIPYKIIGGIKFYDRKEIKDVIAYLKLLNNPHDTISLLRIINTPSRKIGAASLNHVQNFATRYNLSLFSAMEKVHEISELSAAKQNDFKKFVNLIYSLRKLTQEVKASSLIKFVIEESGYKKMLVEEGTSESESRLENIAELISVASKYDALEPGVSTSVFLEEIALIADIDSMPDSHNSVTLMTLHAAKGLEFPYVFMIGLEEGIFPHSRSLMDPEQLEEERRLMYVGITRAEKALFMSFARSRLFFGEVQANAPSQFLNDIPKEIITTNAIFLMDGKSLQNRSHSNLKAEDLANIAIPVETNAAPASELNLKIGDRVIHPVFGKGAIINLIGGVVTISFENKSYGIKKLALSVAPLEKLYD